MTHCYSLYENGKMSDRDKPTCRGEITHAVISLDNRLNEGLLSRFGVMLASKRLLEWALVVVITVCATNGLAEPAREAVDRLRPVDTSSPRALIYSLQQGIRQAAELIDRDDYASLRYKVLQIINIFDFSDTPPALISQKGPEHFAQLADILGRLPALDLDKIPDSEQVHAENISRWTFPGTELTVHKIVDGSRQGEFLFTPETFRRIPEFYGRVADLPRRPDAITTMELYQLYRSGAGSVFPVAVINKLPAALRADWFGQPGWKWPVLFSAIGLIALFTWPFLKLRPKYVDRPRDDQLDISVTLRRLALPVYMLIAMQALDYLASRQLRLTGTGHTVVEIAVQLGRLAALAYILNLLIALLAEGVIKILHTRRAEFDSQLIRLAFRIVFWVITVMVIAVISERIGVPVAALAAGVGVGGLAFALAAQSTLENLVAGLTIYGDRPIRVGDFCTIGGVSGKVQSIGLRSTRLRTLERTLVTIPNAEVAKQTLENISVRDRMLLQTTIGLRYETTPDQLRYVLGKLRELFYGHPMVHDDGMRIRFIGFGASSLDIEIYLYVKATMKPAFLEICEDLNLRVMQLVQDAGAGFAIPSQRAYLARDTRPDADLVHAAEACVESWRKGGVLPFPDLSDSVQEEVADRLDYPPSGSPGSKSQYAGSVP